MQSHNALQIPDSLQAQLDAFRRQTWFVKVASGLGFAACGLLLALILMFLADRIWETPPAVRFVLFALSVLGFVCFPMVVYRWVWRYRHWEQLASLLARRFPSVGDQLLGIIELSRSETEQARSKTLCAAAISQVAQDAISKDFTPAVPNSNYRRWGWGAAVLGIVTLGLVSIAPRAVANAWTRLLLPWTATPRYTFVTIDQLPDELVVAHGEPIALSARLNTSTRWSPEIGHLKFTRQKPLSAQRDNQQYAFQLPSLIETTDVQICIGDYRHWIRVRPELRPELKSIVAHVTLPKYLQWPEQRERDIRGGRVSVVRGSRASFVATASRQLNDATVDGKGRRPEGDRVATDLLPFEDSSRIEFRWRDHWGLEGKDPFTLTVDVHDDEPPSLVCEGIPRQKIVLDSEQLTFQVRVDDDFGIKQVGIEWARAIDEDSPPADASHNEAGPNGQEANSSSQKLGERILSAGGHEQQHLQVAGTFSAQSLGISPQLIELRVFAEDYLPDRKRVYSPVYSLLILDAREHAIWLTEQLSRWHRQSLEVRDREMQLFETNKELREMASSKLDEPETRQRIESQAAAERTNGRRLSGLVGAGEQLVLQATRNPEFGVGHLEKWAEMLQVLKDISGNRMPSVAELLKQSAQAASSPGSKSSAPAGKMVGNVRATPKNSGGSPEEQDGQKKSPKPGMPSIQDIESTHLTAKNEENSPAPGKKQSSSPAPLRLPFTALIADQKGDEPESCPAKDSLDDAVEEQEDLLAEFEEIADELNKVLANLEGSTLVKRRKAASRQQNEIAGLITSDVRGSFGEQALPPEKSGKTLEDASQREKRESESISTIMDDIQGYFERRRMTQFKTVFEDMKKQDVVRAVLQISEELRTQRGISIAQCEFWSDNLDRWAEDLVDPASGGT